MKIALAQISVQKNSISENIKNHIRFINVALKYKTDYIVFPELSLTGYELEFAITNAFEVNDSRMSPLIEVCKSKKITAIVGAPIKLKEGVVIGEFIILPSGNMLIYSKRHLHDGESALFVSGSFNPVIIDQNEVISFAICADTNNPDHSKSAYNNMSSIYIASVLFSCNGYVDDTTVLKEIAKKFKMTVFMANYSGKTGGFESAGCSKVWDYEGNEIAGITGSSEGLLIVQKNRHNVWEIINLEKEDQSLFT